MIEIKNLTKKFGSFTAVDNVSISVKKGTIHGIIGENGAGKTTIIQCLTGIYKPDGGCVEIDSKPVYENPRIKEKTGYVADSSSFFNDYKVKDMIKFFKGIYKGFSEEKFDELNKSFKIDINQKIGRLSKGQKMRVSFMLNLGIQPEVLVLDEPTSGLDPIAKKQLLDMVIQEVDENQMTVFISSHHLGELEKLCDEISIINNGRITYQSSIDGIKEKIKKLQVVFHSKPQIKELEKIAKTEKIGSVYYLTTDSFNKELTDRLKSMGAGIIEEVGMSLEEIFIFTAEQRGGII